MIGGRLTIFAVPKAFSGHFGVIQENAVRSWTELDGEPQIVLFGDDEGVAEAAAKLGVRHVPTLGRNEFGTPLLSDLFAQAHELAEGDWLCYINSDVILVGDVGAALATSTAKFGPSVFLTGRRWRTDVEEVLDFQNGWRQEIVARAKRRDWLDLYGAMDWFLFPRTLYAGVVPPFAMGRTRWDSWLISEARSRGATLVDGTDAIVAIHQEHRTRGDAEKVALREGPEGTRNRELAADCAGSLGDANWKLTPNGLERAFEPARLRRRFFDRRMDRGLAGVPSRVVLKLIGPDRFHRWLDR